MKYLSALFVILLPMIGTAEQVVPIDKVENSVNIRLNADTDSDVVGELQQGESLTLVSSSDGWHEVELEGGATGFISSDWSRIVTDAEVKLEEEAVVMEALTSIKRAGADAILTYFALEAAEWIRLRR